MIFGKRQRGLGATLIAAIVFAGLMSSTPAVAEEEAPVIDVQFDTIAEPTTVSEEVTVPETGPIAGISGIAPEDTESIARPFWKFFENSFDGTTKHYKSGSKVTVSARIDGGAGQTVLLMRGVNRQYSTAKQLTTDNNGRVSTTFTMQGDATYYWIVKGDDKHRTTGSYITKLTRHDTRVFVSSFSATYNQVVPWKQNYIEGKVNRLPSNLSYDMEIWTRSTVHTSWRLLKTVKGMRGDSFKVEINKGAEAHGDRRVSYQVRIKGQGITTVPSAISNTYWNNPYKGSALERELYNTIKPHCAEDAVVFRKLPANVAGTVTLGEHIVYVDPAKSSGADLRTVALHECAHLRQWALYEGTWQAFVNDMRGIYGSTGFEGNADCIAAQWGGTYMGYGTTCEGRKGQVAYAMAMGRKY